MWSLAFDTLVADRGKLLTALVGVVFSIVLVNVQGGLFVGLIRRAGLLVDCSEAVIWCGHKQMHNVDFPRDIPKRWTSRIRAIPGVKRADPYLLGFADMALPSGGFEGVVVVGVDRAGMLGQPWNLIEGEPDAIFRPDSIIVDATEDDKLESPRLGEVREIGGRRARIAARSHGIMGFLVTPYVFTNVDSAAGYLRKEPSACSYILVSLEPGADRDTICAAIRQRLPEAEVLPKEEYSRISINFWMIRTGLGISFGAATLLGLLVGMIMVAQTLYTMVLDRLREFGTLKAIGASESQVYAVLLSQSLAMALVGSAIGLGLVSVIQRLYHTPRAPIVIPLWLSIGSCMLVLLICLASSLLPYQRVRRVDPLMVLQS
ncbi:MAG: FtsX-like permease family protein [Planctomycetota bacterium]